MAGFLIPCLPSLFSFSVKCPLSSIKPHQKCADWNNFSGIQAYYVLYLWDLVMLDLERLMVLVYVGTDLECC